MDACHGVASTERDAFADDEDGGASSISRAEPHFLTTQLGASRSVSPLMARSPRRFMKARKRGEESWYLSGKSEDGRIRYVWRAQVVSGGRMDVEGNVRRRVGWRPVGSMNAVRYVVPESCGERWCREGKEKRVGFNWVLSPMVVRKPPRESSSGSVAFSLARTPISVLAESPDFWNFAVHVPGGEGSCRKTDKTSDCDMAS